MQILRFPAAALVAAGVTFGLFLLMFKLISSGGAGAGTLEAITGIRFGPLDIPEEVATRSRRIPEREPPPRSPPPPPRMQIAAAAQPPAELAAPGLPDLEVPLAGGRGMFTGNFARLDRTGEGDVIPIVKIRPMYPREAAMRGIEGWVKVEFTITENGSVRDPKVIEAEPPRVFNREALSAIRRWKFKPRIVDGVAVERTATQTIGFRLNQDRP